MEVQLMPALIYIINVSQRVELYSKEKKIIASKAVNLLEDCNFRDEGMYGQWIVGIKRKKHIIPKGNIFQILFRYSGPECKSIHLRKNHNGRPNVVIVAFNYRCSDSDGDIYDDSIGRRYDRIG